MAFRTIEPHPRFRLVIKNCLIAVQSNQIVGLTVFLKKYDPHLLRAKNVYSWQKMTDTIVFLKQPAVRLCKKVRSMWSGN
jgi:hypothetical protein